MIAAGMGDNGGMSEPALAPPRPIWGLAATWAVGAVAAILVGILAPRDATMTWFMIGFGACILFSFAAQLLRGVTRGFILRAATGALGALLVMGVVSVGFAIGSLFAL